MNFHKNPRFWVLLGVTVVALLIVQQFWHWEVERIEVPAGKFLVRIHRWGKDLGPDQLLAPDDYKKHLEAVLPNANDKIRLTGIFKERDWVLAV